MCYASFKEFVHVHGAIVDIHEFALLYGFRRIERKIKIPRSIDRNFDDPQTDKERQIKALIDEFTKHQLSEWEPELFTQRKRLADAERALATKETKKALNDQRVSQNKIGQLRSWISEARTSEPSRIARIYPQHWAPVMVWENGRRVVKPMRYGCRMYGWTPDVERKYLGTYNARRDSLEKSWSKHFGVYHAILPVTAFYENVALHTMQHRPLRDGEVEKNVVLKFDPQPRHDMLIACVYSRWRGPGEPDMLSFAAITDEPPPEVLAAGHDRCIVPIKPENIDRWLQPDGDLKAMHEILEDRDRPYYEHAIAA